MERRKQGREMEGGRERGRKTRGRLEMSDGGRFLVGKAG